MGLKSVKVIDMEEPEYLLIDTQTGQTYLPKGKVKKGREVFDGDDYQWVNGEIVWVE